MTAASRTCPASAPAALGPPRTSPTCPERPGCPASPAASRLPRDGAERAVMLALRYVAAAAETGDAACFDAAFDGAEAAFGPRDGALLVARAAALVRALRHDEVEDGDAPRFLPPPCRFLSPGESRILALLRLRLAAGRGAGPDEPGDPSGPAGLSVRTRAALTDLAAPVRSAGPRRCRPSRSCPQRRATGAARTPGALSSDVQTGRLDPF